MKKILPLFLLVWLVSDQSFSQSTMEFQSGTTIEVQSGADICADTVIINGTYTGSGTKCEGPLPVEVVSVSARPDGRDVIVNWTTATETNSYGFEVERKLTTQSAWTDVGFIQGAGTSASPKEYSFTDKNVASGLYGYRLKLMNTDGSFIYSNEENVQASEAPRVFTLSQNYPNPFNPTTTIDYTLDKDGLVMLKIYDISGREVETLVNEDEQAGVYHQVTFNAGRLGSGTYFYRIESQGKVLTKKLLLLK